MNRNLTELHLQRGRLIERCATQRRTLTHQLTPVRTACQTADRTLAAVRTTILYVQQHPAGVAAFVTALLVLRPRRVWGWLQRGFFLWRAWRRWQQR
jgi:hypothetical protein